MSVLLPVLCFGAALVYAMAGFGGGSAYLAFFSLFALPVHDVPPLALTCNLIVVTTGTYHFVRAKQMPWRTLLTFIATSVPLAYVGGLLRTDEWTLRLVTGIALILAAVAMLVPTQRAEGDERAKSAWSPPILGALLGLLSGFIGIGGGIFLSPILHLLRWETPKRIAALASAFIFVNSISGLVGQLQKGAAGVFQPHYWWILAGVFLGGQIGTRLGVYRLPPLWVKRVTAVIVLTAGAQLAWRAIA